MSRRPKYVPQHRDASVVPALGQRLRRSFVLSGVAVVATGLAVGSGILTQDDASSDTTSATPSLRAKPVEAQRPRAAEYVVTTVDLRRAPSVSRSAERTVPEQRDESDRREKRTSREEARAQEKERDEKRAKGKEPKDDAPPVVADPRVLARQLMPAYGLSTAEFSCLDALWVSESDWDMHADNPTSTAYGIPQALQSAWDLPADYRTNAETQIRWGLWYINNSYGSACSAWEFKQANNWY